MKGLRGAASLLALLLTLLALAPASARPTAAAPHPARSMAPSSHARLAPCDDPNAATVVLPCRALLPATTTGGLTYTSFTAPMTMPTALAFAGTRLIVTQQFEKTSQYNGLNG